MANSNYGESFPKTFSSASKKVALNAFMAAVLGIIIYMSVLLIFRTIGTPKIVGYVTYEITLDKEGRAESEKAAASYYFKDGEETKLPQSDKTHKYSPIYTDDAFPEVFSQILMLAVYSIMIYNVAWGYGAHTKNEVTFGHRKRDKFEGAKVGLASSVVYYIALLLLILAKLGSGFKQALGLFGLVNASFLPLFNEMVYNEHGTFGLIAITSNTPADISWVGVLIMLLPLLYKVLLCFAAYELGYRGISLKERIMYKKQPSQKP